MGVIEAALMMLLTPLVGARFDSGARCSRWSCWASSARR